LEEKKDVYFYIADLDRQENFFYGIEDINKYNIKAIIELIQYENIKEYGECLYTKNELLNGIKKYFNDFTINN